MNTNRKIRLEKLLKENKRRQAKIQLIEDLKTYYDLDVSDQQYADNDTSERLHQKVYEHIKTAGVEFFKFPYDEEMLMSKVHFMFNYYKKHESAMVFLYPATFGFYFRSGQQLYLDYPTAIQLPLWECKEIVMKIMLEMHDDVIVVSEELDFGFVLSEDEYSQVTIEYWGE